MNTTHVYVNDDQFVTGYNRHLDERTAGIAKLHLEQFIQFYNRCFGHHPTTAQLDAAVKFVGLFMDELHSTYPNQYVPGKIRWDILMHLDPVSISESLAVMALPPEPVPTATLYFEP